MGIDKILVTIIGFAGIAFTYWFFLRRKDDIVSVDTGKVRITVDGGYSPSVIEVPQGKPTEITFFRKDPSDCLEEVVISGLKIRKMLPLNQETVITVMPPDKRTYPFACGMHMFHGKIIVK